MHSGSKVPSVWFGLLVFGRLLCEGEGVYRVGVARVDITPDYPIRLCGYACRGAEATNVAQRLYAKALVLENPRRFFAFLRKAPPPAVLVELDSTGFPASMRSELLRRLQPAGVRGEAFAMCATHSHNAPMVTDFVENLFGKDIPADQQEHINRYTRELTDKLELVVRQALERRRPATLATGMGRAGFGKNRRPQGGPSDPEVPLLAVRDRAGKPLAILVNYACHCTTLTPTAGGDEIAGDWAGYAQQYLEEEHPGAIAFTLIGCGADQDPYPRTGLDFTKRHGREIATVAKGVLATSLASVSGPIRCSATEIALPFVPLPARADWERKAKDSGAIGYHARRNLERLERGERLPTELPYLVQVWTFGESLALAFLPGEVVVDYALRLKSGRDSRRFWVTAYANDVPCYIPSKRVWKEGGYEAGDAMIYFDRPARLSEACEDRICAAVDTLTPSAFAASRATGR
jgi:hypothetical protein